MKTVISVSVDIIKLMQAHYPETLGKCFLLDAPAMFHVLWKVFARQPVDSSTLECFSLVTRGQSSRCDDGVL